MNAMGSGAKARGLELFRQHLGQNHHRADRFFRVLVMFELAGWLAISVATSEKVLAGSGGFTSIAGSPVSLVLGAILTATVVLATSLFSGRALTRHLVAVCQTSLVLLAIRRGGGELGVGAIVAVSVAFLGFYRDGVVLFSAGFVVGVGWLAVRAFSPMDPSLDLFAASPVRLFWVMLEILVMNFMIGASKKQIRAVAERQALLEQDKQEFEAIVLAKAEELAGSRENYRFLESATHSVPWEMDASSGDMVFVGPQVEAITGVSATEWLKPAFLNEHLHPDDLAEVLSAIARVIASGVDQDVECRFRKTDADEWMHLRSVIKSDKNRTTRLRGLLLDVTYHRRLESELQKAQKLESVGRLATGVAHEINTPIQFVTDSVSFAREAHETLARLLVAYRELAIVVEGEHPEEVKALRSAEEDADVEYLAANVPQSFERALDGLERVAVIVRSMKEFAHPGQREKRAVDINRVVQNALLIAKNEYKYVADTEVHLAVLPAVTCEGGEIGQAVLNIVVNAAHAIADKIKGDERGMIKVRTEQAGDDVIISIEDTGGGIPPGIQKRIFDPFFTTKESGRGTGQGLAIARSVLVDKHGGDLTFESQEGVGTTFVLRIPIAEVTHGSLVA